MLKEKARKYQAAKRRKYHIRNKMNGTAERPRLSVYRSNRHIYAQLIDDVSGVTLASASTMSKDLRDQIKVKSNKEAAAAVGQAVAKGALKVGIKTVSFDRGSSRYQGRTRTLAEAARKAGLVF